MQQGQSAAKPLWVRLLKGVAWTGAVIVAVIAVGLGAFVFDLHRGPPGAPAPDLAELATVSAPARAGGPANIVLIVADDLGYGGLSSYGGQLLETPNIDALARNGVRFTQAYATASVCAPSRAGLLSGRYQERFGFEYNPNVQFSPVERARHMPGNETTIAESLAGVGYRTGIVGKWHLGVQGEGLPGAQGFDESFALLHGAGSFIARPEAGDVTDARFWTLSGGADRNLTPIVANGEPVQVDEYVTDRFAQEASSFIVRNRSEPFFLYVAFTDPHGPLEAPARYLERFPQYEGDQRTYAAKMAALDDGVGLIMDTLRAQGLLENTLVVFVSDNGCPDKWQWCEAGGLANFKGSLFEGGVRVPLIVSGATIAAERRGQVSDAVVSLLDLMPTFQRVAGAAPSAVDGLDLASAIGGAHQERTLFWRAGRAAAIRSGNLKLVSYPLAQAGQRERAGGGDISAAGALRAMLGLERRRRERPVGPVYSPDAGAYPRTTFLYDLAADPGEQRDLSGARPEDVERLERDLAAWNATLASPMWGVSKGQTLDQNGRRLSAH